MTMKRDQREQSAMTVTPAVGLIDEPLHIIVQRLPPSAAVTGHTCWTIGACPGTRTRRICADADGAIDLTRQAPVSGTYAGVDGEGLVASLAVAGNLPSRTFDNSSVAPLLVEFAAQLGGHRAAAHKCAGCTSPTACKRPRFGTVLSRACSSSRRPTSRGPASSSSGVRPASSCSRRKSQPYWQVTASQASRWATSGSTVSSGSDRDPARIF